MNPVYLLIEIGATVFFVIAGWLALRRGRLPFLELVSAAAFGLLLEQANQIIFETYEYSPEFALAIDRAPIVIGLTWALIIAGAMRITDALGVRRRYAPFVDSLLAISLDLAFDAVAIRMGLWTWRDVGPEQGWFGVPAGNFYSWLFVVVGFSLFTRWLRDASHRRPGLEWLQLLVPLPAFAVLTASIGVFAVLKPMVDSEPGGGLLIFWICLGAFVAVAVGVTLYVSASSGVRSTQLLIAQQAETLLDTLEHRLRSRLGPVADQAAWIARAVEEGRVDLAGGAALDAFMLGALGPTPQVFGIAIVDPSGRAMRWSRERPKAIREDWSQRLDVLDWVGSGYRRDTPSWGQPLWTPATRVPALLHDMPLHRGERFLGMLGQVVAIATLSEELAAFQAEHRVTFLVRPALVVGEVGRGALPAQLALLRLLAAERLNVSELTGILGALLAIPVAGVVQVLGLAGLAASAPAG